MTASTRPPRIAVLGHVEHVTLGRVAALPGAGDIAHLGEVHTFPGGGGGIAFSQLASGPAEVHLFTAVGEGEAGREVAAAIAARGATVHAARRAEPHTRDLVMITPDGERTIVVVGEPLHPRAADPLPWELLARCDAVYFTAQDPALLRLARAARLLVVTARRRPALVAAGVRADVVVGSAVDPREVSALADYPLPPRALVLTEGAQGGAVHTAAGVERFEAPPAPRGAAGGAYGAGDSFAGALVFHLAAGRSVLDACRLAAPHGAAVLRGPTPLAAQRRLEVGASAPATPARPGPP